MATCRETVEGTLRKLGKLGAGRSARAVDLEDGLEALKALYRQLIDQGTFGRLRDVTPLSDYTAGENERVFRNTEDVETINLPELVQDDWGSPAEYGSRWVPPSVQVERNRPPRDCAVVVINDGISGTTIQYLYDGQQKKWVRIDALGIDDEAPLTARDFLGLKATLAISIADEYGQDVTQATLAQARLFQSSLVHRWSTPRRTAVGEYV